MSIRPLLLVVLASCVGCAGTGAGRKTLDVAMADLDSYWVGVPEPDLPAHTPPMNHFPYSCAAAMIVISGSGKVSNVILERVDPDSFSARRAATARFRTRTYVPSASNATRQPVRVRAEHIFVLATEDGSVIDMDLVGRPCNI